MELEADLKLMGLCDPPASASQRTGNTGTHRHACHPSFLKQLQSLSILGNEMGKKAQLKCKIETAPKAREKTSICSSLIISLNGRSGSAC